MSTGHAGELTHIKFCFVIKSIFFKKNLYLVCNCIICGNANFLFLKPRKNIFIYMFFKITKIEILEDKRKENIKKYDSFIQNFNKLQEKS